MDFTHEVADGMHGAIVKAVKRSEPKGRTLPIAQVAEQRRLLLGKQVAMVAG